MKNTSAWMSPILVTNLIDMLIKKKEKKPLSGDKNLQAETS